ncbi:leucine-rich repeat protein [Cycloclasticus sp.]
MFNACKQLRSIEIPSSVTPIHSFAFGSCFGLTTITCIEK